MVEIGWLKLWKLIECIKIDLRLNDFISLIFKADMSIMLLKYHDIIY